MSKMKRFYIDDALMQMERSFGYQEDLPATYKEYRYEERGDTYSLRCWCDGRETSTTGVIDDREDWLVRIIDIAKVGGHMSLVREPPPDCIVWFQTDADNNLQAFKEMSKR
jgi:hypothetical protein